MPGEETAVSTSSMRAEADQRNAAARKATRVARAEATKTAQMAHEASLIDAAAAAQPRGSGRLPDTGMRLGDYEPPHGPATV